MESGGPIAHIIIQISIFIFTHILVDSVKNFLRIEIYGFILVITIMHTCWWCLLLPHFFSHNTLNIVNIK